MCNQCGYWNYGTGCRACEECGITSNMIDDNCDRCKKCEGVAGELRWTDSKTAKDELQKAEQKEKAKEIEVKAK